MEQPRYISHDKVTGKCWYTYALGFYSVRKKNENMNQIN